jgi:hypothetical protein
MIEVGGIEFCIIHGGILTEGTDYHGSDGMGCEYPESESDEPCVGVALFYERPGR